MHFWKSSNSPTSSSSSPKSSPPSPLSKQKRVLRDISHLWSRREQSREPQPPQQPRLTRQRKLRHISEFDIRPSVSASSTPLSRSPSRWGPSSARSLSAVSHPLPVPDDAFLRRGESALSYSSSNSGLFPLPSPKEAEVNGVDVGTGDGPLSSSPTAQSRLSYPNFHKGAEHVDTSTGSMLDQGKHAFQDSSAVENIRSNFKVNFPAKSAPTSGFSSPVLSPRRLSTGDFSPSAYMSYQGQLPSWSDPVFPASDMIFDAYASPEKFLASPGRSPLHSPRTSSPGPKSPSRAASPKHPKMAPENNAVWHDNNVAFAGHPLPLPPGAAVPSQTTLVHQGTAKSDVSPMISQWQKTKLIGSGTFGNVYVAINRETGASCAMKEVNIIPDDLKSIESVKQLEQEIKVLSKLKHPNIVQYFGSEIVEDRFYIYLEYVHPGSINKYIREHCGAMTESVVRNFTRHIVSGLAYLHSTKTIHRDIKGANLLVDASGVVKLADFGMAKHLTGQGALSVVGSPYWMAPEVLQANMMQKENGYDLAVDIWSLGCTIIEMFTGKPPWSEFEGAAAMFKVLRNESPPTPETLSADGKSFLQCCFQKNPADRPSASQLLEHPFLRNSHHQEIHSCIQAISDMKLTDMAKTPRERTGSVQKLQGTQVSKGKQLINGEAGNSHPESSESAAPRRHSPRSTLEAISSLFPSRSDHITYGSSHRSNALHGTHLREQLSSHI